MSLYKFKKGYIELAVLVFSYYFLDFVPFAIILVSLVLYRCIGASVDARNIRRAGVLSLIMIFILALFSSLAFSPYKFVLWNFSKDFYFFLAPVVMMLIGLLYDVNTYNFNKTVLYCAKLLTFVSIVSAIDFLLSGAIFGLTLETRYEFAMDSGASTLALLLIIGGYPNIMSLLRNLAILSLVMVNVILVIVSLSRVNITIIILSLAFVYIKNRYFRSLIVLATVLMVVSPLLPWSIIVPTDSDGNEFFGKFANSMQELRISDYTELSDINQNWRGYEAYLGVNEVLKAGWLATCFGTGFGSYAVGPFDDKLMDIPYFHNGLVTIFLKSGIVGLGLFAYFIAKLFFFSWSSYAVGLMWRNLQLASGAMIVCLLTISTLMHTLTTHGVYHSKTMLELFFLGSTIKALGDLPSPKRF